jgi:hypothetical protein
MAKAMKAGTIYNDLSIRFPGAPGKVKAKA